MDQADGISSTLCRWKASKLSSSLMNFMLNFDAFSLSQDGDKRVLTISQKKFCADGNIGGRGS